MHQTFFYHKPEEEEVLLNEITADEYKQIQEKELTNWKEETEQIEVEKKDMKMFKLVTKQEKSEVNGWIEQYKELKKLSQ